MDTNNHALESVSVCAQEAAEIAYKLIRKELLSSPCHQIMKKMVDKMLGEHPLIFHSIRKKISQPADLFPIFTEMYSDGKINWGRLVATFAICCAVSTEEKAGAFVKVLERFVYFHLAQWIIDNGGWDGFCQAFSPEKEKPTPNRWGESSFFLCRVLNYF